MAIGGGGSTGAGDCGRLDHCAGSGSGYVENAKLNVSGSLMHFEAKVGSAEEASLVIDLSYGNKTILEALPGGSNPEDIAEGGLVGDGSPGYSGGGADRVMSLRYFNYCKIQP